MIEVLKKTKEKYENQLEEPKIPNEIKRNIPDFDKIFKNKYEAAGIDFKINPELNQNLKNEYEDDFAWDIIKMAKDFRKEQLFYFDENKRDFFTNLTKVRLKF